jgi:hypothetical protein
MNISSDLFRLCREDRHTDRREDAKVVALALQAHLTVVMDRCELHTGGGIDRLALGQGVRLLVLSNRFRVIDLDQHVAGRTVLAALDRNLGDASIDPRCGVEPCCVRLPLTSSGSPRTRYQIDKPATATTAKPTTIDGTRLAAGACFLGACFGGSAATRAWMSAVGTFIPHSASAAATDVRSLRGHRHHIAVEIGDDPDRAGDHEKDDQHAERKGQNIVCAVRAAAQMQEEDEVNTDLR